MPRREARDFLHAVADDLIRRGQVRHWQGHSWVDILKREPRAVIEAACRELVEEAKALGITLSTAAGSALAGMVHSQVDRAVGGIVGSLADWIRGKH
jgi:hypothetical protein